MKSIKTTISGVVSILSGLVLVGNMFISGNFDTVQIGLAVTAFSTGVGLIFAPDANKVVTK